MNPEVVKLLQKGFASQQQGDLTAAEKSYRKVLKRDRQNEFALNLMGVVCIRTGRAEEAIKHLTQALRVNPNSHDTHNNIGLACKDLNKVFEAQAAFEKSLSLRPDQPDVQNNLGNILASLDRHEDAIARFEASLKLNPGYVGCLENLSVSLRETGRLEQALHVVNRAIELDQGRAHSHNCKGEILLRMSQYAEARATFERAIDLNGSVPAKLNLSTALKQLGDDQAAVRLLQEVIDVEPHNAEALNSFGVLQEQLGNVEQAAKYFRLAIESVPSHASSYYQLSKLKNQRLTQEEIQKIHSLLDDPLLLDIFRSSLLFALACDAEKDEDYVSSMEYFGSAQAIKAGRSVYDSSAVDTYIEESRENYPLETESIEAHTGQPIPVFIVGMPRSGTTLTEQVISSHSEVSGAGEVAFIAELVKRASELAKRPYPGAIRDLSMAHIAELREIYFDYMIDRCGDAMFVVDKNPLNYNHVGFIVSIFPEAKILYCKRDAMDNCVSIFRLPFDDNQGYSHDLKTLGLFYRQHEELMGFWRSCYPDQIMQVDYEETVEDLETQARRILGFIGVDFEERVLDFFNNDRIVMTPSAEQVRQPIYKTSVNAWKRYGSALAPLMEALNE